SPPRSLSPGERRAAETRAARGFSAAHRKEHYMRHIRTALIALAAIGTAALAASAANAQTARYYGPLPYGSYYSYGADRANPSLAPNGWDQDNPRDQQLQGTR